MGTCEVPARLSVAFLVALGVMVLYMLRVNLSVAIVAMVQTPSSSTSTQNQAYCNEVNNITAPQWQNVSTVKDETDLNSTLNQQIDERIDDASGQLLLTGAQKGMVLGAFFYGYIITSIPGGRLAELYGTKIVFGCSILATGILTLFTPIAAKVNYIVLIVIRVLIGVAQGVVYPSLHVLVARWIPPMERPRFISVTYMANCLGTIMTLPLCGLIIDSIGWPAVFYITGGTSLLWVILWAALMFDFPINHPRISEKEKEYIIQSISEGTTQKKPNKIPWRKLMTSMPLWAIHVAHMGGMFSFTLLLTQLPTYMNSVLGFSIKKNGLLSSLPFLAQFLGSTTCGFFGDWLLTHNYITVSTSRKTFTTISLVGSAITLVAVGYVGCHIAWAVALFPISSAMTGAIAAGHMANHLDLSPNYSGTLLGLSNTIAFSISMCVPVIVGALTTDNTLAQWRTVFWLTGGLQVFCWLFYMIFSKFEIQPWNFHTEESKTNVEEQSAFISNSPKPQILTSEEVR